MIWPDLLYSGLDRLGTNSITTHITFEVISIRQWKISKVFNCVDFKKFYVWYREHDIRPIRRGIALGLTEWAQLQRLMEVIHSAYPTLATAEPCYMDDDHMKRQHFSVLICLIVVVVSIEWRQQPVQKQQRLQPVRHSRWCSIKSSHSSDYNQ